MTRPGDRLRSFARRICAAETLERVIDPLIADLQFEHANAERAGQMWRARRLQLAGYLAFWKTMGIHAARTSVGAIRQWAAADRHALGRTIAFSLVAVGILTMLLVLPPFYGMKAWQAHAAQPWRFPKSTPVQLFLYLIPQAIPLAVIFGLPIGILCGLRGRRVNRRVLASVMGVALMSAIATFVLSAWILPETNQAFRLLVTGRSFLPRGDNELTLWELRSRLEDWNTPVGYARSYYVRWAVSFAPIVLGLFAVGLSAIRRRTITSTIVAILASSLYVGLGFLVVLGMPYRSHTRLPAWASLVWLPIWAAVWLPNVVLAAMSMLLFVHVKASSRSEPVRDPPLA